MDRLWRKTVVRETCVAPESRAQVGVGGGKVFFMPVAAADGASTHVVGGATWGCCKQSLVFSPHI